MHLSAYPPSFLSPMPLKGQWLFNPTALRQFHTSCENTLMCLINSACILVAGSFRFFNTLFTIKWSDLWSVFWTGLTLASLPRNLLPHNIEQVWWVCSYGHWTMLQHLFFTYACSIPMTLCRKFTDSLPFLIKTLLYKWNNTANHTA